MLSTIKGGSPDEIGQAGGMLSEGEVSETDGGGGSRMEGDKELG